MDIKDIIKMQIINNRNPKDLNNMLKHMVFVMAVEGVFKHTGTLLSSLTKRGQKAVLTKLPKEPLSLDSVMLNTKSFVNKVELKRDYKTTNEGFLETNQMVDAILSFISKLDNVPSLKLIENGHTLINFLEKPLQITKDIYIKVDNLQNDLETGKVDSIVLSMLSNTISASELSRWIRQIHSDYKEELKNAFGDTIYFFDQKQKMGETGDPRGALGLNGEFDSSTSRMMKLQSAPKQLSFTKSPFYSNKSFKNIFGKQVREIEDRVNFFLENKDWYDQKGIPYQLGLLLSGVPGSGKTSIIRAIANKTRRHIINVNFANIATASQLKNLFFSEKIVVYTDTSCNQTTTLTIPLNQRIYVLEEIDSVGDIVRQRINGISKNALPDELTLGEILTVLDGTLESPGRMVIMTSNFPDILDKALIRPGRMDVSVKFGYADRELIVQMYESFFDLKFPKERTDDLPDELLTAAEVGQVLFRHFKKPDIDEIITDINEISKTVVRPVLQPLVDGDIGILIQKELV